MDWSPIGEVAEEATTSVIEGQLEVRRVIVMQQNDTCLLEVEDQITHSVLALKLFPEHLLGNFNEELKANQRLIPHPQLLRAVYATMS